MGHHRTEEELGIGRRTFVSLLGAAAGGAALTGAAGAAGESGAVAAFDDPDVIEAVEELSFYSTASQIDANGGELDDEEYVVAWASEDAYVMIADDDTDEEDVVFYEGEDARIPLITQDGSVMGIGSAGFLSDERGGFSEGNEQFVLNAWDELMGPDSTVLWDESHAQFYDLGAHSAFRAYAEDHGYDLHALAEFEQGGVSSLQFYSTASQVAPDGGPLTDEEHVLAWAEESAYNVDENDDGAYIYADDESIPLISRDGGVVGLGNPFVSDDDPADNYGFLLNVWADLIDGDTVYWDESHGQFYGSWQFGDFISEATEAGFEVEGTHDFQGALEDGDAIVITTPEQALTDEELDALDEFVAGGGSVFLHDQSEFGGHDETGNLNEIADRLDLAFRFNADQVEDGATGWAPFVLETSDFAPEYAVGDDDEIGLGQADGLVVTTPARPFFDSELDLLAEFVADGGALFLFDQSDFGGHDETGNLNEIADRLDLAFRFNGGQVEDEEQNAGPEYVPISTEFSEAFDYFADRPGIGFQFERGETYYGQVVRVFDGDTFEVEFAGSDYGFRDVIRHIGMDTSETPPAENEPEEWFGIPDDETEHLYDWGAKATEFSLDLMAPEETQPGQTDIEGRHVAVTFDPDEPLRGNYGRLLMHMYYDPQEFAADFETGEFSINYNRQTVEEGYARVYSSGFSKHDEWSALEEAALDAGTGIWSAADFDALTEIRNHPVEELYFPPARSIRTKRGRNDGRVDADRVPVFAEETAEQQLGEDGVAYGADGIPLAAVDRSMRLALVGGVTIHEEYDGADEEFPTDTSGYGNFPFLTTLIDSLGDAQGHVIVAGGQGQFNAPGSISLERCQYYLRYLEGVGTRLRQINDLPGSLPAEDETPRAVIITAPDRPFEMDEIIALRRFRNEGGAIVLLGSAENEPEHAAHLNDLAHRLNTDLRFNDDVVFDEESHLADDPAIVETAALNDEFDLFDAYELGEDSHPGRGRNDNRGESGEGAASGD